MNDATPHYLLKVEANREGKSSWQFVLRQTDGTVVAEAADVEPGVWGDRLDLLTVVRALEALDEPSRVTLTGCTRYVEQGIQYGLVEWRENDWRWEFFGQMVPVRDVDLWQRMDRILKIHRVDCLRRRIDAGHPVARGTHWDRSPQRQRLAEAASTGGVKYQVQAFAAACVSAVRGAAQAVNHPAKASREVARYVRQRLGGRSMWNIPVKFRGLASQP